MPTLAEQAAARDGELWNEVAAHPLVRAVLDAFPGATIAAVRERFTEEAAAGETAEAEPGFDIADETGSEEDAT